MIMGRATKSETENRVFTIQGWILDGVQNHLIIKQIMTEWDLSSRQAERLISRAFNEWNEVEGIEVEKKRRMKIAELKQKARSLKAEYKGTPSGLNAILRYEKEIMKLEGLYLPKEKKVTHANDPENPLPQNQVIFFLPDNGRGDTYDQLKDQNT